MFWLSETSEAHSAHIPTRHFACVGPRVCKMAKRNQAEKWETAGAQTRNWETRRHSLDKWKRKRQRQEMTGDDRRTYLGQERNRGVSGNQRPRNLGTELGSNSHAEICTAWVKRYWIWHWILMMYKQWCFLALEWTSEGTQLSQFDFWWFLCTGSGSWTSAHRSTNAKWQGAWWDFVGCGGMVFVPVPTVTCCILSCHAVVLSCGGFVG